MFSNKRIGKTSDSLYITLYVSVIKCLPVKNRKTMVKNLQKDCLKYLNLWWNSIQKVLKLVVVLCYKDHLVQLPQVHLRQVLN